MTFTIVTMTVRFNYDIKIWSKQGSTKGFMMSGKEVRLNGNSTIEFYESQ
ncbi:hypothetical protein [Croceivirga thetidis]|uniref:Uncharacterized protein n=1 Tax=Croceivirga thetidis TaxID=2721623 RepID=A0ABX1GW76_9FLAO|nr:hypothetical protein [Croceivirga thetidis]NKI33261.1 hypothetical protein [Croceivirga thetidis]